MRILLLVILLLPVTAHAQSDCEVIAANAEKGVYKIQIDGETHLLVTKEIFDEAASKYKSDISVLEKQLAELNTELDKYEKLRTEYAQLTERYNKLSTDLVNLSTEYKTASTDLVTLNSDYKVLVRDYDELTDKYRDVALHSSGNFKLSVGFGVNNSEKEEQWDLFVGTGLFGFNGWFYGNTDRLGIALGKTF